MTRLDGLPLWIALPVAALVIFGSTLTFIGALGMLRMPSFYDRIHAPTLGTSWGTAGMLLGSMILFSWVGGRPVLHEFVVGVLVMVTTPVTLMMLGRAALHRDRGEGAEGVPSGTAAPEPADQVKTQ